MIPTYIVKNETQHPVQEWMFQLGMSLSKKLQTSFKQDSCWDTASISLGFDDEETLGVNVQFNSFENNKDLSLSVFMNYMDRDNFVEHHHKASYTFVIDIQKITPDNFASYLEKHYKTNLKIMSEYYYGEIKDHV